MSQEFYSFDEVLKTLQIEQFELERMIEEGEVKAYSDGGKIQFLKDDINTVRFTKMDQPTITVSSDQEEVGLIEEIYDEDEDDDTDADLDPEPLFSMDSDSLDESPAKSEPESFEDLIGDKTQTAQPILDMDDDSASFSDIDSYEAIKAETEELIFEEGSGDEMLETGESLFDQREQMLPRDKEVEELFSESSLSYFDSKETTSYRETVDLSGEDEDIIGTSSPYMGEMLAIDASKRRRKIKTISGLSVGFLLFACLCAYVLFESKGNILVSLYTIGSKDYTRKISVSGNLQTKGSIKVLAKYDGVIEHIVPAKTFILKRKLVATFHDVQLLKK